MKIINSQNHLLILFLIIPLIGILLISSHSTVVRAKTNDSVETIYLADEVSSMDFPEALSSLYQSTLDSGKIWSDKSVFPKTGKTTKIELDKENIEFEDDFLEVLSVIGSTSEIEYPVSTPHDYVLLLDLSSSMAFLNQENYRIHQAVTAVNSMANEIIKSNPENRIGIICFGMLARVLVEIDNYTEFNLSDTVKVLGISKNITIDFNGKTSEGQVVSKQITNTKKGVFQYTNIRDAFTLGFSQFIENSSANDPYLILISNGNSTAINTQSLFEDTIMEEDLSENFLLYGIEGISMAENVSVFITLLNGAYQKSRTEKALQKEVKVFALGFDVEDKERESLKQYLDPKSFFTEAPDNIILTWWNRWISDDNSITLPLKEINSHSSSFNSYSLEEKLPENYTIPKFTEKNGVLKSDIITNFNYIDQYYEISFDHIETILGEFIEKKSISAFHPVSTEAPNDLGDIGALTFYDPIGEGMKISQFKGVSLFGKFYPVAEKNSAPNSLNIREYFLVNLEPEEAPIINSAYTDHSSFTLDQIKIQILVDASEKETLKITFPETALPVFKASLTLSQFPDISGHRQIISYELKDQEDFSKPIRFFYTLRKTGDFRQSTENQIYMTNLYSSNTDSNGLGYGDTYLTFTPSPENPYYFVRENEDIYKTKLENDEDLQFFPIESMELTLTGATYYIKKSFYSSSTGYSELMYPLIHKTDLAIQSEALNRKNLYQHHPKDLKLKTNISTDSAETVLYPQADPVSHSVKHFLGNNGKLIQNFKPASDKEPNLVLKKYQRVNDKEFTTKSIEVSAGDSITYLLILENTGNKKAEKIKVWDIIPDDLEYINDSASTNGTVQNKKITWDIPLLNPGEKVTLNFKVSTPRKDTTTSWENSALFQEKRQLNPEYSNKVVSIIKPSKLTVEKLQSVNGDTITKSLESIRTGDTLTYFLTIYNAGPGKATNVTVSDTVPSGLTLIKESITNSGIITNNEIKWNIDQINPYERRNLSFSVIVANSPVTKFYNMALLREENDKTYFSNTVLAVRSDDVMESLSVHNVMIEKKQSVNNGIFTKDVLSIQSGDSVTYLITILNESDSELRNVQISDKIPPGLDLDFSSVSPGGVFLEDSIVWTINRIPPRGKRDLEYKMQLDNDTEYTYYKNSARLTHSQSISPIESNEVALRRLMPNLNLSKSQSVNSASATQNPVEVKPLDKVTYYLTVENSSPTMNLKAIKIIDPVDPSLIVNTASISGNGIYEDGSVIWYIPALEPEEVKILYFTVSIPSKKDSSSWSNYAKAFIGHSLITDSNTVTANKSILQQLNLSNIEKHPNMKPAFLKEPTKPKAAPETGTRNFVKVTLLILLLGSLSLLFLQRERFQIFRITKRK